jgi:putative addiction module component (TIGR02574 family)
MNDFSSVLGAAQQLAEEDRVRLIDALRQSLSPESEDAIPDDWAREIELRVAELETGTAQTIPWSQVRDDALARVKNGQGD